jgi:polysaccharide deacetylase 2 family uncharacterized protein YibQ/uncharacterized protein YneF (UPF0154 family)
MKKNKKKNKKNASNLKYIIYILLLIVFALGAFIVGILYTQKNYEKELKKSQNSIKILQEKIKKLKQQSKEKKEYNLTIPSEIIDYEKSKKFAVIMPPKILKTPKKNSKPKLVIIIDDVSFKWQVKKIKEIPFSVTPSFFPPTKTHPNTPIYAKEFTHYMVHLPLQAIHFNHPEPKTLNINDSYKTILNRIKEIKKFFPDAKFINNHTGSTFTANKNAMIKLFRALKFNHLGFVDSKTTPFSKAEIAKTFFNIPLYSRNIFLDNEENPIYIKNQLKKAINIAKKRGYAIAIGHPHIVTLLTLKNSKDLLKNIDVVYIDELENDKKN